MKKITAISLACFLTVPTVPFVQAAEVEENTTPETVEEEQSFELEKLDRLSFDEAIERSLNKDKSLVLLKYQTEIIDNQLGNVNYDLKDIRKTIRDLNKQRDRLKDGGMTTFLPRYEIQEQLKSIDDVLLQLESAYESLKSGEVSLRYSEEEAKEQVKLLTASTYIQLKIAEQQINLQKQALQIAEKNELKVKLQSELGTVSADEYDKQQREVEKLKTDIEEAEKQYRKDLFEFTLDLGIEYHEDFVLEPLNLEDLQLVQQETDTETLIENSYQYKKQVESIDSAQVQRDIVYRDDDSTKYKKAEADLTIELEKQKLDKLRDDLDQSIRTLYHDAEEAYQNILNAKRDLEYAEKDYNSLNIYYRLGLVSKNDYESAKINVDQAKLVYELAKHQYFLITKQIEALEAGVI